MIAHRPGLALAFSGQIASTRIRKALAAHGLRPGHGHALLLLADQGPTGQAHLAEAVGVDPSVLVAILNDLERDGLAERRRDPADRRRHIVEISAAGRRLADDVHGAIAAVEGSLFADLDAAEVAALQRLLDRIRADGETSRACAGD
ncbi:MarR family winged helix-turn-helix transcriptional regulator [Marinitenerispora sediminis]|uniref:MarR family transcriptional regulator n=1 Tax=Marinitenerispora sediminis TaxID=1931232 RepID=A0A368SZ31_9ACTN|nr:MarR family winged helix-turn-helix transcriptional regulator [Marinitenerispora sediminis]RCV48507.1 MarR family transcriptional regulator [Marinitenerispora sediminis]RCV50374.1 MarR family transcriptional regulator [Marinitenerispora sediminis]RCV57422.1 MarR family transcriptional regulator [Marinitenerispora sediminis]